MANEFHYSVSLSVVHPTADAKMITAAMKDDLAPKIETTAGSESRGNDGKPRSPRRTAALSHWSADLHGEERIYSSAKPISDFVLEQLTRLEPHRELFKQLRQNGEVFLVIGWFSESNHSAGVLSAEALKKCGDLGIDIELDFYGPLGSL